MFVCVYTIFLDHIFTFLSPTYDQHQVSKAKIPNINILPCSKQRYQNFHFHFQRCRLLNENVLSKRKFLFPISLMSTSFGDKRKRRAAKSPSFVLTENDKYLIWFGWNVGLVGDIFVWFYVCWLSNYLECFLLFMKMLVQILQELSSYS